MKRMNQFYQNRAKVKNVDLNMYFTNSVHANYVNLYSKQIKNVSHIL